MGRKKNKKQAKMPNPYVLRVQELILPTFISLAIIASLILVFSTVKKDANSNNGNVEVQQTVTSTGDLTGGITELETKILEEGKGERVSKVGDTVSVHYTGSLVNGTVFDSSVERGVPFELTLGTGSVIPGWEQGLLGMKVGEKRALAIPYSLAYGEVGQGSIPPKATLVFEVELLDIK